MDTHILLWSLAGSSRIDGIRTDLENLDNQIYFSVVSLWEIAIKSGLGKLDANVVEVRQAARDSGFVELSVLGSHVEALMGLAGHHRDPFDRLLVAQAKAEPMRLITADPIVARYDADIQFI